MSPTQNQNSDEIDLKDLLRLFSKGIKAIVNSIIDFIAMIRSTTINNYKLFVVLIAICVSLTLTRKLYFEEDIYGSSMVISSRYLNTELVENTITKLNVLAMESSDNSTLSDILNIEQGIANQIIGFEVKPFVTESEKIEVELLKEKLINLRVEETTIDNIYEKIQTRNQHAFEITVLTESNGAIYTLDSAISKYFKEADYLRKRIEADRNKAKNRKEKLIAEQKKLDSLKQTIFEVYRSISKTDQAKGSDNVILGGQELANPLAVFEKDLNINNEILAIEKLLFLNTEFEVIEGLTPFSRPLGISSTKMFIYSILVGICVSYLLLILIGLNKFFNDREKANN